MPLSGIANPEQLSVLTRALQDYCAEARIKSGSTAYDNAARLALSLFEEGITTSEGLAAAMRENLPARIRSRPRPPRN